MKTLVHVIGLFASIAGCDRDADNTATGPSPRASETWVRGDVDERFALVAKHLRGFDVAMVETGYRYGELYWAGQDRNWDYARYQLEKIEVAVANGIERRPQRAASAAMLAPSITRVRDAVQRGDEAGFADAFSALTQTCNACHAAEQVAFVHVGPPAQRVSPVGARANTTNTGAKP
jgi:hypothetical protein